MEKIYEENLLEQYKRYSAIYGTETNFRRMVPDVRDGLKLVQRRILHIMYNKQPCATKPVKTASIVGDTMKVHPHGDSSIAGAVKVMSNWFDTKEPLVYSESNMGSMQGGGAAAPRYTEVMLSKFALDCVISDMKISKDVVDWIATFDNTSQEPEYMPVSVPLLLINGTSGIGFGMRSEVPKHNITEVIDATINLIKNPNAQVVLIPDHCMPCEIIDTNWKSIANKGIGNYMARGIVDIETRKDGGYNLVIRSTPDGTSLDKGSEENGGIKYKILELVKKGKLPQITGIDEESNKNNMRMVIHLRKGSNPNFVRDTLYKNTDLQSTYYVNFEALNGLVMDRYSYKSYLQFFIEQRKITKFRLYCSRLQSVRTKYHEKIAYINVLESGEIDNIINMIKKQKTIDDNYIIEYIVKHCNISDIQAKFIINSNLKNLSMAYLKKYKSDAKELAARDKEYMRFITDEGLILQEIINELESYKQKYGKPRVCKVITKEFAENIPEGKFKIVITENGFIKKLLPEDNILTKNKDTPIHVINVENKDNLLLFTDYGKVFKLPVHKVDTTDKNAIGYDMRILIKGLASPVVKVFKESDIQELAKKVSKYFLVIITKGNNIKKIDLDDVCNVPLSGILYTKLNDGDIVKDICIVNNKLDLVVYSNRRALRLHMDDVPHYKRQARGVSAMGGNKEIDGVEPIYKDAKYIVIITTNGKINKFDVSGLAVSSRGKAGSPVINLTKGDNIFAIYGVNNNNVINITTKNQKYTINVSDIKMGSSISTGTKIGNMRGDSVVECKVYKTK